MARILGLDFGKKRIGLAISDELFSLAHPLASLEVNNKDDAIAQIKKICQENKVIKIVLGLPRTLKGKIGPQAREVQEFNLALKRKIRLPVILEDERWSTALAYKMSPQRAMKAKKYIDQLSAQIILQAYLDKLQRRNLK